MAKKIKRTTTVSVAPSSASPRNEFNPDYTAVKKDLKRIGMLASFFITVLVVLSFFLR